METSSSLSVLPVILFIHNVLTDMLSPAYIVLSLIALSSRYVSILKVLASHGKTIDGNKDDKKKMSCYESSWCWVSKQWFVHFYILGLISMTSYIICRYCCWNITRMHHHPSRTVASILLMIHLCRRTYECWFVHKQQQGQLGNEDNSKSSKSQMHIAGYVLGMGHYLVLPSVFWNTTFEIIDDDVIMKDQLRRSTSLLSSSELHFTFVSSQLLLLGTTNLWLQYEQYQHHLLLANLRNSASYNNAKKHDDNDDDNNKNNNNSNNNAHSHYTIPPPIRWFRWILCPHYLAEILLYGTFAMILECQYYYGGDHHHEHTTTDTIIMKSTATDYYFSWYSHPFSTSILVSGLRSYRHWWLLVWVATNLTVSALNNYDWYHQKQQHYCKSTKNASNTTTSDNRHCHHKEDTRTALIPKLL